MYRNSAGATAHSNGKLTIAADLVHSRPVVAKVCPAGCKGSATSSQEICRYITVMATLEVTFFN